MSLTSLELTVDQNHPGWLPVAARDGAEMLSAQGRPQMARALRKAFERCPELSTLRTYLRLSLVDGIAPAVLLPVSRDLRGPLDGRAFSQGKVPRRPRWICMDTASSAREVWHLGVGSTLIGHRKQPASQSCILESLTLKSNNCWRTNNTLRPDGLITHACSDGEGLALLRRQEGQAPECILTDPELQGARWRRPVDFFSGARNGHVTLALAEQAAVLFDAASGRLVGLSRESGEEIWQQQVPGDGLPAAPFRLIGSHLCLFLHGRLYVFDVATGQRLWSLDGAAIGPFRAWGAGDHLHIEREGGMTCRYNLPTGESCHLGGQLSHPGSRNPGMAKAIAAADEVAVVLQENRLHGVRLEKDYPLAWAQELPSHAAPHNRPSANRLFVVGEAVILVRDSTLGAYRLGSGEPLWEGLEVLSAPHTFWGDPTGLMMAGKGGELYRLEEETSNHR